MPDLTLKLIILLVGGALGLGLVGGLLQKIVWNFLITRKGDGAVEAKPHCEEHPKCLERIEACEQCNSNLRRDHAALDATFKADAKNVDKRLNDGRKDFRVIREKMEEMGKNITYIRAVVDERSKRRG